MTTKNRAILERLFADGGIQAERSGLFDTAPAPLPASFHWDRVEGMLLGLAIGDSLGATSEGMLPGERRRAYGEITDYLPNRYSGMEAVGLPSDDTQLAFFTLEQMLADGRFDPASVADRFCRDRLYGIGGTVRSFIRHHKDEGKEWFRSGSPRAGNGALMRIAPMVVPHLREPSSELWIDTALSAMITHNDAASTASCVATIAMIWDLFGMDAPPEAAWWVDRFVSVARGIEFDEPYTPRGGQHLDFKGPLTRYISELVPAAFEQDLSVLDAGEQWYSGAFLLETMPSVLYILMRHGHDFEEAVVRAVNDTKDNDTIAAIVGATLGALHGRKAIPERWVSGLLGRLGKDDDGRIFELVDQARAKWGP